jgi:type I site-specific restriction endonuclease
LAQGTRVARQKKALSAAEQQDQNFKAIADFWLMLRDKGGDFSDACTPAQRKQFVAIRDSARDAFFKAANTRLEDNNALIEQIRKDLKTTTGQLKTALDNLTMIEETLKKLAEAVKLAASIVTLAAIA